MKNYVAKLRENEEKGFSLVELIIVMAIMAILVGVVASQVIPYMEKSKLSKDQENLASLQMDVSSAIATSGCTLKDTTVELKDLANAASKGGSDLVSELCTLRGKASVTAVAQGVNFKSKKANDGSPKIYVKTNASTGEITVLVSKDNGATAVDSKLSVSSAGSSSSSSSSNGN